MTGRALPGQFRGVSPDGVHLVTTVETDLADGQASLLPSGRDNSILLVWPTTALENPTRWDVEGSIRAVSVSNARVAAALDLPDGKGEVRVWSPDDPAAPLIFPGAREILAITDASLVISNANPRSASSGEVRLIKLPASAREGQAVEFKKYPYKPSNHTSHGGRRFFGISPSPGAFEIWDLDAPAAPPRVVRLMSLVPEALSDDGLRVVCRQAGQAGSPVVLELAAGANATPPARRQVGATLESHRAIRWGRLAFVGGGRYLMATVREGNQAEARVQPQFIMAWDLGSSRLSPPREYQVGNGAEPLKFAIRGTWIFAAGPKNDGSEDSNSILIDLTQPEARPGASAPGDPGPPRTPPLIARRGTPSTAPVANEQGKVMELAVSDGARWVAVGLSNGRVYVRKGAGGEVAPVGSGSAVTGDSSLGPDQGRPLHPTNELTGLGKKPITMSLEFVGDRWLLAWESGVPVVHVLKQGSPLQDCEPRQIGALFDDSVQGTKIVWPARSSSLFGWQQPKVGGEIILRWDMASPSFPATHLAAIRYSPAGISPSGRWLAAGRGDELAWLFDLRSPNLSQAAVTLVDSTKPNDLSPFRKAEFSPDERFVIFKDWVFAGSSDWALWSLTGPQDRGERLTLPGVLEPEKGLVPSSMGFEPGGKYIWAVGKDKTVTLFALGGTAPLPVTSKAVGFVVGAVSDAGDLAARA